MKKFLYYLYHTLINNCPDKDLDYKIKGRKAVCKCGRRYFIWYNS